MDQRPSTCIEERDCSPYKLNVAALHAAAIVMRYWRCVGRVAISAHLQHTGLSWTMYTQFFFIYSIRYYTQYRNFKGSTDNISVCLLGPLFSVPPPVCVWLIELMLDPVTLIKCAYTYYGYNRRALSIALLIGSTLHLSERFLNKRSSKGYIDEGTTTTDGWL